MVTWVVGYISGRNFYGAGSSQVGGGVEVNAMEQWLDNRCQSQPFDKLVEATRDLITELEKRK